MLGEAYCGHTAVGERPCTVAAGTLVYRVVSFFVHWHGGHDCHVRMPSRCQHCQVSAGSVPDVKNVSTGQNLF